MMAETETARHTLGEAARLLRISRHTLDKWLERLGIEPARHAYDYRFYVLTGEQVQAIREARAQMPGKVSQPTPAHAVIPSYSTLAFDRRPGREGLASDALPAVPAMPRQRPLRAEASTLLADGMMSRTQAADVHGVARTTFITWCRKGLIETADGAYGGEHGHYAANQPVTRRGLAQLYALASGRPDFTSCPDCPHSELLDSGVSS